jgi:hypothetical protein
MPASYQNLKKSGIQAEFVTRHGQVSRHLTAGAKDHDSIRIVLDPNSWDSANPDVSTAIRSRR